MSNDKKPNYYKKDMDANVNLYLDAINEFDNTDAILNRATTRYTEPAEKIIEKVQKEFLEKRRKSEIDQALANRDEERFMLLTSKNWKDAF
ncbi:IDEAL domain-containing protein [Mesobacillus boroniphilus]|uniref:IDEAL domain-containing protein n=1 Tax=Mesobacillus boroniphilus TaxID=308892 RepID=A0A944CMG8_9BACI|nr:IDEAL domain-containing protein [Mesobacillus boroniphilus]MBS8265725.1 IDEAL domain-containing protein [Mesobacillus boroniphilus]